MNLSEITALDAAHVAGSYQRFPLLIQRGKGAVCYDDNSVKYIDFTSGIGVNSLGFCDEGWVEAVSKQAATLGHTSNLYYTEPSAMLAAALTQRTGYSRVFFANSGAEANECAIKMARKYMKDQGQPERYEIITLKNSFHGRTLASLAATGQPEMHLPFAPMPKGFSSVPADDVVALRGAISDNTCAIMIEPIQGEGGVLPLSVGFLSEVRTLCEQYGLLLIADEVQTGIGRTGTFLASEQLGIAPDIVTLAKGLGGGLPIGAALFSERCAGTVTPGSHGSTFGANPICAAGACYVLSKITPEFLSEVKKKGDLLRTAAEELPGVSAVAGMGLMLGLTVEPLSAKAIANAALGNGLLVLTAKEKVRLLPPLTITSQQLKAGIKILETTLERELHP